MVQVMIKNLEQVLSMILNSFCDPHPRVRWAAINAIGQLSTDLGPDLQVKFHHLVLPALAGAMDDFQNPRVQAHAASAVLNFTENCTPDILTPYLDGIVSKLLVLLQNGKQMVQEGALTALASVADSSQEQFQKYYDAVMPYLKAILVNANDKSNRMLRAKAMECISLVGMAVGKEKFRDDAKQVMDVLMSLQQSQLDADDPTASYMLQAWARLCKCLGQDFLPYMGFVMPPLIQSAQLKPDVTITSADSDTEFDEDDDRVSTAAVEQGREVVRGDTNFVAFCFGVVVWVFSGFVAVKAQLKTAVPTLHSTQPPVYCRPSICVLSQDRLILRGIETITLGDKRIGIKTSVLEEKATACNMLCCYADELKEGFFPWIDQVAFTLVPLLKFYFHEEVRKAAVSAMPELLSSAKSALEKGQSQGRDETYLKQLSDYIIPNLVEALHKEPEVEICATMLDALNECIQVSGQHLNEKQVRSIVDEIKQVLTASSSRKHERAERAKEEDFDAEERELLKEENEQEEDLFDEVGDCLGTLIKTFRISFLPFFDELSSYITPMFAAVYGVGVCAEFGGSVFKPLVGEALSRLDAVIRHPNAQHPDNVMAYDNAVSALGKICQFHRDSINATQVVPAWLSCLPIKGDLIEAKVVHDQLCSMVERSDTELIGPNNQYLPKIVAVFAE
ncbi:unnamed protein product, partial [Sphenostylis stenocarpa]